MEVQRNCVRSGTSGGPARLWMPARTWSLNTGTSAANCGVGRLWPSFVPERAGSAARRNGASSCEQQTS